MLPKFSDYKSVFLETTKSHHDHGGAGWEFGTCLWSPVTNITGAHSYELMKEPQPGDLVLHNYHFAPPGKKTDSYLCGFSKVSKAVIVRSDEPPSPGTWSNRKEYYRIDLEDFSGIESPLNFKTFTENYSQGLRGHLEHERPRFFPFTISGGIVRLNQGMYLTRVTSFLYSVLCDALGVEAADIPEDERIAVHRNYSDGERSRREVTYFQRNPKLAQDAKELYKFTCQICGYRPSTIFGEQLQSTGLDCHHLDPMSERTTYTKNSTLADITVLCANCHRLVHSKRPALSIEKAKKLFKKKPFTLGELL